VGNYNASDALSARGFQDEEHRQIHVSDEYAVESTDSHLAEKSKRETKGPCHARAPLESIDPVPESAQSLYQVTRHLLNPSPNRHVRGKDEHPHPHASMLGRLRGR
jgi:hypothetical protein